MTPRGRKRLWYAVSILPALLVAFVADCMFTGFVPGMLNHPRDRWGDAALAVMHSADSVEVIRIVPAPGSELPRDFQNLPLNGMVQSGNPVRAPDAWVLRMREAVDNSLNYQWIWHARCLPRPGVCVRFHHGDEVVDLLICFECSLISLAKPGGHGGNISHQWIDFRVKRSPFAELVKEMFPNDAAIQAIGK